MDERTMLLASFLYGPEWRWWTEVDQSGRQGLCSACGRPGGCASDCAPDLRVPPRQ